jgi:hypothetical protein
LLLCVGLAGCTTLKGDDPRWVNGGNERDAPGDVSVADGAGPDGGDASIHAEADASTAPDTSLGAAPDAAADASSEASSEPGDEMTTTHDPTDGPAEADGVDDAPSDGPNEAEVLPEAGWTPRSLGGLVLWLVADTGVEVEGNDVKAWADRSPYHHRALPQSPTHRPVFLDRGIGQHPGVAFAGNADGLFVKDSAALRLGSRDFVIQFVFRHTTPTTPLFCQSGYGLLYGKADVLSPYRGAALFANLTFFDARGPLPLMGAQLDNFHLAFTNDGQAYNDDVPRAFGAFRQENLLSIRLNGSSAGVVYFPPENGVPANVDAVGNDVAIGSNVYGEQCLRGVVSEIVVATDVTREDLFMLETYLFDKYADALRPDASK